MIFSMMTLIALPCPLELPAILTVAYVSFAVIMMTKIQRSRTIVQVSLCFRVGLFQLSAVRGRDESGK